MAHGTNLGEPYPDVYHQSLHRYIDTYLRQRNPHGFIGEFLDDEARRGLQFGLGGTSFLLFLARREGITSPVTLYAEKVLTAALKKLPQHRTSEERHLTKDLGRIASKTTVGLLFSDDQAVQETLLNLIFEKGLADGLIKLVFDDPTIQTGDPITTAYFLHILHVSGITLTGQHASLLESMLRRLHSELLRGSFSLFTRLFMTSALCLHNRKRYVSDHLKLLNGFYRRYRGDLDLLSSESPFIDRFYEDTPQRGQAKNRYVRIPKAYVVLLSIYIATMSQKEYYRFPLTKLILSEMDLPYDHFAQYEKGRSAVYFVFFVYLSLLPKRYFNVRSNNRFEKLVACINNRINYHLGNLTWSGWILMIILFAAVGSLVYQLHENGVTIELLRTFEVLLAAFLGLTETKKR